MKHLKQWKSTILLWKCFAWDLMNFCQSLSNRFMKDLWRSWHFGTLLLKSIPKPKTSNSSTSKKCLIKNPSMGNQLFRTLRNHFLTKILSCFKCCLIKSKPPKWSFCLESNSLPMVHCILDGPKKLQAKSPNITKSLSGSSWNVKSKMRMISSSKGLRTWFSALSENKWASLGCLTKSTCL